MLDEPQAKESLFFTQDDMTRIREVVDAYRKSLVVNHTNAQASAQNFLDKLQTPQAAQQLDQVYEYPQFFLASLVYHSQGDWMVQTKNDIRFTSDKPPQIGK